MNPQERIVLRLDQRIAFERDFTDAYRKVPRARRQEWVRSVLRAGLEAVVAGGVPAAGANAAATDAQSGAESTSAPAPKASAATTAAKPTAVKVRKESATALRGLFGESELSPK